MDMLFGLFKTRFFQNLEILWEHLQNSPSATKSITRNDIGLLCYGSQRRREKEPTFPLLHNVVEEAFSIAKTQHAWADKLGVYPKFTRAALKDPKIRSELVVDAQGNADDSTDPNASYLQLINQRNKMCCDILDSFGYNGELLRAQLPAFQVEKRAAAVTAPRTMARQEALEAAATQGQVCKVTGGVALNDDDFIIADERKKLWKDLEELEKEKKIHVAAWKRQQKAMAIIESEKQQSKLTGDEIKDLIAWKTQKPCPSKLSKKDERLARYLEVKDLEVPAVEPWPADKETAIMELTNRIASNITLDETEYGRHREDAKAKAKSLMVSMSPTERQEFLRGLMDHSEASTADPTESERMEAEGDTE